MDIVFYIILAVSMLPILFIISLLRKRGTQVESAENESNVPAVAVPRAAPAVRRVGGSRVTRRRLAPTSSQQQHAQTEEDAFDNFNENDIEENDDDEGGEFKSAILSDSKIGAKKRKKLEMKAEKKAQREQEVNEREERLKRQALLAEKQKQEDAAEASERAKQEEEEKRTQKEKEEREHEEYLKLKATFQVEASGFEEQPLDGDSQLLTDFINHIIKEKVVQLEELATQFKLKTQDVIDRINSLLESKDLNGVIDDRGKFIYISDEEMLAIAKFVNQRGRVTISELVENSNSLIMMNQKESISVN